MFTIDPRFNNLANFKLTRILEKDEITEFEKLTLDERAMALLLVPWCDPCRQLEKYYDSQNTKSQELQELLIEHKIPQILVDINQHHSVGNILNIRAVPHIIYFSKGESIDCLVGHYGPKTLLRKTKEVYKL